MSIAPPSPRVRMTKRELLDALTVERHMPGPRPPRTSSHCDPPRQLTAEEQQANRELLIAALDGDVVMVDFHERKTA